MVESIKGNKLSLFDVKFQMVPAELESAEELINAMYKFYFKDNHTFLKYFISKFLDQHIRKYINAWAKYHFVPDDRGYVIESFDSFLNFLATRDTQGIPDEVLVTFETLIYAINEIMERILNNPNIDPIQKRYIARFVAFSKDDIPYRAKIVDKALLAFYA
jgi:hypothetical protein